MIERSMIDKYVVQFVYISLLGAVLILTVLNDNYYLPLLMMTCTNVSSKGKLPWVSETLRELYFKILKKPIHETKAVKEKMPNIGVSVYWKIRKLAFWTTMDLYMD